MLGDLAGAFSGGSGLPEQQQERLIRLGYLRMNVSGMLADDLYVTADHISTVTGNRVELDVPASALAS